MGRQLPIEIFMPPNMLKAKVGSAFGGIDMAAIKRAEGAVDVLKAEFTEWLADDVNRLAQVRDRYAKSHDAGARGELFRAAHDLKGQADTFGFPMIGRVASSLTKLIDATEAGAEVPLELIDAHVAAVRVIFRDKIQTMDNAVAQALANELEARVADLG